MRSFFFFTGRGIIEELTEFCAAGLVIGGYKNVGTSSSVVSAYCILFSSLFPFSLGLMVFSNKTYTTAQSI